MPSIDFELSKLINDAGYAFIEWDYFDFADFTGVFSSSDEFKYKVKSSVQASDYEKQNSNRIVFREKTLYITRI